MKTYEDWKGDLKDYLQPGDVVDEEISEHFLNVMPPAFWRANLIQMGESPVDYVEGKGTYHTLEKTLEGWVYRGTCHKGETRHRSN
ncbi:hypothetical protein [Paenibacillus sp. IHBB 3054]|uniref:hypothetical protein n=1 Tax=Paenibacillus sp. IHBB 3054 TaxID=3425689 RepID=UPI003F66CC53